MLVKRPRFNHVLTTIERVLKNSGILYCDVRLCDQPVAVLDITLSDLYKLPVVTEDTLELHLAGDDVDLLHPVAEIDFQPGVIYTVDVKLVDTSTELVVFRRSWCDARLWDFYTLAVKDDNSIDEVVFVTTISFKRS